MIGIVVVSHSASLADGILELAREMAGTEVKMAAAGGLAMPGRPLGTDAALVAQAIEAVDSGDGVLVLMDLGSAVLSAEMALEMVPPELRERILLCGAPLVEGAVAAAVQAKLGCSLAQAAQEAQGALAAKAGHLEPEGAGAAVQAPVPEQAGAQARILELTVPNKLGLHARPAARFVQTAGRFPGARITVRNLSAARGPVDGKSINGIAMLGLARGQRMAIAAEGDQAGPALEALRALAADNFGDSDEEAGTASAVLPAAAPVPAGTFDGGDLAGFCGSTGLACGPARHFQRRAPEIPRDLVADPAAEWARLLEALERVRNEIRATLAGVVQRADRAAADLFEAHLLYLDDAALREPVRALVFERKLNAAAAWHDASEAVAGQYEALDDAYLRDRAADVRAVAGQVAASLLGEAAGAPSLSAQGVLVAADLTPADTARLDPAQVLAICTAFGGPTSHSAILARAFGIPAVVGLGERLFQVPEGTPLLVDAEHGRVTIDPDAAALEAYQARRGKLQAEQSHAFAARNLPASTLDGRRIEVGANIGSLADAKAAVEAGAEGVGLLRTEFLFTGRRTAPDEEEQFQSLRAIAEALDGRPMVIRTLDVGGDKPMPFLPTAPEANPFLGERGLRLCLARPEFFKVQLRAIQRVAAHHPVKVMFPMVATRAEFRAAKALLAEAGQELRVAGEAVPARIETGIMVEIPAAALRADLFVDEVDFFSIGTNDLTQYTMAAERGNPSVAALNDGFQPAVLELVRMVVETGHAHGIWVGMCGEFAGDPLAIPILVGLGIDELSMSATAVPAAKQLVRELDYPAQRDSALRLLRLDSPEALRAALGAKEG